MSSRTPDPCYTTADIPIGPSENTDRQYVPNISNTTTREPREPREPRYIPSVNHNCASFTSLPHASRSNRGSDQSNYQSSGSISLSGRRSRAFFQDGRDFPARLRTIPTATENQCLAVVRRTSVRSATHDCDNLGTESCSPDVSFQATWEGLVSLFECFRIDLAPLRFFQTVLAAQSSRRAVVPPVRTMHQGVMVVKANVLVGITGTTTIGSDLPPSGTTILHRTNKAGIATRSLSPQKEKRHHQTSILPARSTDTIPYGMLLVTMQSSKTSTRY